MTFPKFMFAACAGAWVTLVTGPIAVAETLPQFDDGACYGRVYSVEHMRKNPGQNAAALQVKFYKDNGWRYLGITAVAARTKANLENRFSGASFGLTPICIWVKGDELPDQGNAYEDDWRYQGLAYCGVECDGGTVSIESIDQTRLKLKLDYLVSEDSSHPGYDGACGLEYELGDHGPDLTTYVLYRLPDEACD